MTISSHKVKEVLDASARFLKGKTEEPYECCEYLLSCLLKCKRLDLHLKHDIVLSEKQLEAMRRGIKRLSNNEPVQYIAGYIDFMGHDFKTDNRALIPRPETELLVEEILKNDVIWTQSKPIIVDVGTGTGCIVASLALEKPQALYIGLDISTDAISLAQENAKALSVNDKIYFTSGELADTVEPSSVSVVVSNPPYIETSEYEKLPAHIRRFEPRIALDGGAQGLEIIEQIINDASMALRDEGWLYLEIGTGQGKNVSRLLSGYGFNQILIKKDYAGHDRIAIGKN